MAIKKVLKDSQGRKVYPITSSECVFTPDGKSIESLVSEDKSQIEQNTSDIADLGSEVGQLKENQTTIEDIERAMQSLPDGIAVSAQVAVNTAKVGKLEKNADELNQVLMPKVSKDAWYICDVNGNVLAKFDKNGLSVTDVNIKQDGLVKSIISLLDAKVSKIEGKGLSSEDFTTEIKSAFEGITKSLLSNLYEEGLCITDGVGNIIFKADKEGVSFVGNNTNDWSNKVIATYGDSVTAINNGNHLKPYSSIDIADKWGVRVADYFGMAKHYGRGIGGQTFVWRTKGGSLAYVDETGYCNNVRITGKTYDDYLADPTIIPSGKIGVRGALSSWVRITKMFPESIKDTIDVITIMCHNDASEPDSVRNTGMEFVENSVVDPEWASSSYYSTYGGDYNLDRSVSGAICSTIMKLQAWMPNAVLVLMTPISGRASEGSINTSIVDPNMQKVADIVRDTHRMISIPLIDMYATDGINGWNRLRYIKDSIHPYLDDGKKMLARAVCGGLKNILPNF